MSEPDLPVKTYKLFKNLYLIIFLVVGLAAAILVYAHFINTNTYYHNLNFQKDQLAEEMLAKQQGRTHKPKKVIAKGLYLTAYSAGNPKKIDEIINLLDKTELNAVVIDIKDYSGLVLYNSKVPMVNDLKLKDDRLKDVPALIKKLHEHNIYVIARQTVFQDPILAEKKPEWALKSKRGGLWRDNKGLAWVDASQKAVWDYNLAIANEAINLGFDEINFDYVRFPSDGNVADLVYTMGDKKKYEAMHEFYSYLSKQLANKRAWISLDMFGYVMERTDDLSIGQRLVDAVNEVDYICPMMYPSHYSRNSLGHENPAEIPGLIIANGMKKGAPTFKDKRAEVRPWLQAFDLGAVYSDGVKIREQINEVEKFPNAGWLLWNAANRYTTAGLN